MQTAEEIIDKYVAKWKNDVHGRCAECYKREMDRLVKDIMDELPIKMNSRELRTILKAKGI